MRTRNQGFTILEITITIGISTIVVFFAATLQRDIFSVTQNIQAAFGTQQEVRKALKSTTKEMRIAQYAVTGSYPLALATDTAVTFYADADNDGSSERYRYFLNGTTLQKGVLHPSGSPASYVESNETVVDVVKDIANGSTPVFEYYDETYTGTSAALTQPVTIADVRLIGVTLIVRPSTVRSIGPQTYTTQVQLRNLKNNL